MTQKCKITVLKPIDLVVLPPKKGDKKFQLNRTIIEVTLINDPLVTFWISVCPKINILPHDGKKGHFFKVDAWKPIDLVVYHTRIVYNFFQITGRVIEATLINDPLVTFFWPLQGDFFTGIFKGLHNSKLAKFHWFFCFNKKIMKFSVKAAELKICGKFLWQISSL